MITKLLIVLTFVTIIQARQSLRFKRQAIQDDNLECTQGAGYYQHPKDCRFFYICVGHQEGDFQKFVHACPHFTVFNVEHSVCTLASLSAPCNTRDFSGPKNNNNKPSFTSKARYNIPSSTNIPYNVPSSTNIPYNVPSSTNIFGNQPGNPGSSTKIKGGTNPNKIPSQTSKTYDPISYTTHAVYPDYTDSDYPDIYSNDNTNTNSGPPNQGYTTVFPKIDHSDYNYSPIYDEANTPTISSTNKKPSSVSMPSSSVNYPKPPYQNSSPSYPQISTNVPDGKTYPKSSKSGKQTDKTDRPVFKPSTPSHFPGSNPYPTYPTSREGSPDVTQVCQAPTGSIKAVFCQGQGFFRHPDNCSQFYQCLSNLHGDMESYVFNCPKGLVFQESGQQQCTHSKDVPECSQEDSDSTDQPRYPKVY